MEGELLSIDGNARLHFQRSPIFHDRAGHVGTQGGIVLDVDDAC